MRFQKSFCPSGICLDPMSLLSVFGMGASVAGGISAGKAEKDAAFRNARLQEEEADLILNEAQAEAGRVADDRRDILRRQTLAYTKSGVALEGSPLLVLENTRAKSQEEVDAIVKSGAKKYKLGYEGAALTRSAGRAALTSSYMGGVSQLISAGIGMKTSGLFNSTKSGGTGKSQSEILGYSTKAYS